MTSIDKLAKTGIELEIRQTGKGILVDFKDTYVKDSCFLIDEYGRGETVEEAASNYIKNLQGKTIVVNPYSKNRRQLVFFDA